MFRPIPAAIAAATFVSASGVATTQARAHHPGGIGNSGDGGPILTMSASTLEAGHMVAGITIDHVHLDTLSDARLTSAAAAGVEGVHGLSSIRAYALTGAYGITNDLMVAFRLPFVKRTGIRAAEEMAPGSGIFEVENHGGSSGIGDLTMLAQYRFLNNRGTGTQAAVLAGFKAPTGATGRVSRQGEPLDVEFQPGSGAWGGLVGAAFTQRLAPKLSFDASVLYALATTGTMNTDLGDQVLFNAAITYRLASLGSAASGPMWHGAKPHAHGADAHGHAPQESAGLKVDLVLELNGEWHAGQSTLGVSDPNSGGTTIYVSPGIRLGYDKVSAFATIGIPVLNETNGIQPEVDWRLTTGVAVAF